MDPTVQHLGEVTALRELTVQLWASPILLLATKPAAGSNSQTAVGATNGVAIGTGARANGANAFAGGTGATAASNGTAIGNGANAGANGTALGINSSASATLAQRWVLTTPLPELTAQHWELQTPPLVLTVLH